MNFTNNSFEILPLVNEIDLNSHLSPIACSFPEFVESSPKNLIFCTLYFLGVGASVGAALYFYFAGKKIAKNGHQNNL